MEEEIRPGALIKIFVTSFFVNVLMLEFSINVAHRNIEVAVPLAMMIPFINLMNTFAILEAKTTKDRVKVSGVCSISFSLATYLILGVLGK